MITETPISCHNFTFCLIRITQLRVCADIVTPFRFTLPENKSYIFILNYS